MDDRRNDFLILFFGLRHFFFLLNPFCFCPIWFCFRRRHIRSDRLHILKKCLPLIADKPADGARPLLSVSCSERPVTRISPIKISTIAMICEPVDANKSGKLQTVPRRSCRRPNQGSSLLFHVNHKQLPRVADDTCRPNRPVMRQILKSCT